MGVRSVHEALGIYTHDVHRRWGSVFWRWARVIRGRLPVIGRPNADVLHHGPPPAYAHGREAVACWRGRAWPQVHPGVERGARAAAGRGIRCYLHSLATPCWQAAAMRVSTAVPLAVGTTLLTLFSSGYLLGQSTGSNGSTLVVEGNDVADLDFSSREPPAVVATKPSSSLPAANDVSAAIPAPPVDAGIASKLPAAADQLPADYYEGDFLVAQIEPVPPGGETRHLRTLLKSLLGMAQLLKRTLVLPAALCNCKGPNLDQCEGEALGPPFECPLRMALHYERWKETSVVKFRSARFMLRSEQWPTEIKRSHVRLLLPDGMDDSELAFALRNYQSGAVRVRVRARARARVRVRVSVRVRVGVRVWATRAVRPLLLRALRT